MILEVEKRFTIDSEFRSLIPPLTAGEREGLAANLAALGCREPLVVWREERLLLDGHNRHEICSERGIDYRVDYLSLPDRAAAIDWIVRNQLGRRNLTPAHLSYFRGKLYNLRKRGGRRADGGQFDHLLENDITNNGDGGQFDHLFENDIIDDGDGGQFDHLLDGKERGGGRTAGKLAPVYGVGERTIRRDARYADALDSLARIMGDGIRGDFLKGELSLPRSLLVELAGMVETEPGTVRETLNGIRSGIMPSRRARHLELARGVLVEITASKPELSAKLARVEVVNEATVVVVLRDTRTMEMVRHRLRLEEVRPYAPEREPGIRSLEERLHRLKASVLDPFEREIVELLERRVVLTPIEAGYLKLLEDNSGSRSRPET